MKKIVLLGPPGCGKGTQSELLVEKNSFFQLSTGDLLRNEVLDKNSFLGKKIGELMEAGQLVSDDIVIDIIIKKVSELRGKSIIFDGFPRNLNQAKVLDESLKNVLLNLDNAILFEIDYKILESRIEKRIQEADKNQLRKDDNLETLLNRIEVYKESTLPIIDYYEKNKILNRVNGMESVEKINLEILKIIS
jgi:adenylate kinase